MARIGIATGLVVVGDLLGEGAAKEEAVTGETPNLAARLQQVAEPGAVVIADSTRRLIGDLFELVELGALDSKASTNPCRRGGSSAKEGQRAGSRRCTEPMSRHSSGAARNSISCCHAGGWRRDGPDRSF